jgi:predicted transcriptional regulator
MNDRAKRAKRSDTVGIAKGIGPLEAQVLRAISGLSPPVTVRRVCDVLAKHGYFAYQGVLNCMNRLVRKDILARAKHGNAFVYWPLVEREELAAQALSRLLASMGGELDRAVCWMLDIDPDTNAEQIAELRRRVRAADRKSKS